ncbi:hypothetical protein IFM89_035434 [Coptis chinensis]|uniref:3-hydroxyacyl-CoA dehydrogenase n=1 Tax=Coptis chinensis TaxID=261450 RepID=A0A835LLB8_9MAGN|nr:hypothetical protein IFM89_035434 [Coptis chinensis]
MGKVGVTMEVGSDGAAVIKISNPPVNALAPIRGLKDKYLEAMKRKVSDELILSSTSKGLVHAFFAQHLTSKVLGVTDVGLKPRQIKKVDVSGGGLMGYGIATTLVPSNISVVLKEINRLSARKG